MTTSRSIRRGWHNGTTVRSVKLGRFILTETTYPADLRTPWHAHLGAAICSVLTGSYVERFGRRQIECDPSTVLFLPIAAEHADHISPEGATCFIIELEQGWLAEVGLDRLSGPHTGVQGGNRAMWLIEHALREFRSPDATTPLALEGLVLTLAAEFARVDEPRVERRCPPWLRRTRDSLDSNFLTKVTLSGLAADAGVHAVYLAAAFRATFGASVGEYVRARRIEAARLALRDSARSINEIGLSSGFSSQSHFTRVFRRATGMTPFIYRRMHA
ncbi:MAG TPA: helix-turn-helix transcriptional regulator [Gemmatimonadaceae bacterium]|nr:helix-turn-helix transcriptional regulator [Gemmatimonadaceae bacterium]